jgi:NADP-dependent 3-hydroxy acid dehydrogenase YdfG
MKPLALITGATSGIGKATAELLAQNGYRLLLCGRRLNRLEQLAEQLSEVTEVQYATFDIADRSAVAAIMNNLPKGFKKVDVLINNAGNAHGLSSLQDGDIDDWEAMLDINVKGLLYVSRAIIPGMVERNRGHIINIGSIAGKEVYPNGNVYCASKHAVDALNKALRIDLHKTAIRVGAVNPGLVETEFSDVRFKGDSDRAKKVYEGYKALQAEDVAEVILFMLTRKAHINIADLLLLPTDQASSTMVNK